MMRRIICSMMLALLWFCPSWADHETLLYKLTLSLMVPRVYDNTLSLGYRKIQPQRITGYLFVEKSSDDPVIMAYGLVNNTHKTSSGNVTYSDTCATDVMWRYIGSNKTGVFRKPNIYMDLDLNPSYNIGEDEPDNTLLVTLAGFGASERGIRGYVVGQMGCGCTTYGHKSPSRTISGKVCDIVPMCGIFVIRRISVGIISTH